MARSKTQQLAWLRRISGELATATLKHLDDTLPWYADMPPSRRSAVGLVAQAGIQSFITWYDDPRSTPWIASDVFGAAPRELLRSVSLQQTLQLIRVVVEVVEQRVSSEDASMREAMLLYSREIAFAAADVYARAAESRGLWDARLEALVVDSILAGERDDELPSRIAALGWHGRGEVAVIVGVAPRQLDVDIVRRLARHRDADTLIGVQGSRLVVVVGRALSEDDDADDPDVSFLDIAAALEPHFGEGHIVVGTVVPSVVEAAKSARAALAGFAVARAWRGAPRPVLADDLLPERALAGDALGRAVIVARVRDALAPHSPDLLATLWSYLENGRSLEATARELYVHPNTVRYRLKRIAEIVGWDPTAARDALQLHVALILGAIELDRGEDRRHMPTRARTPGRMAP